LPEFLGVSDEVANAVALRRGALFAVAWRAWFGHDAS
jgi:hypothetical protein